MFSWDDSNDQVAIAQLNTELRHAQLELLSAECASDRLRLRFSIDAVAQHAQPDVLRKAVKSSTALHNFYSAVEKQRLNPPAPQAGDAKIGEELVREAVALVSAYLRQQRDHYFALGDPLSEHHRASMQQFFPPALLASVRTVELAGQRLRPPSFYSEAKALGLENLPDISHMDSVTFLDVVVFNDRFSDRALFHGLVHAVQFQTLGLEKYTDLFIRGFLAKKVHFNVPLEAHAVELESKFASRRGWFSVEREVRRWLSEGRYLGF